MKPKVKLKGICKANSNIVIFRSVGPGQLWEKISDHRYVYHVLKVDHEYVRGFYWAFTGFGAGELRGFNTKIGNFVTKSKYIGTFNLDLTGC